MAEDSAQVAARRRVEHRNRCVNVVHAIRVANDGMVYVADRENRRLQLFTNDGRFVWPSSWRMVTWAP